MNPPSADVSASVAPSARDARVSWTIPAPGAGESAVDTVRVWRRERRGAGTAWSEPLRVAVDLDPADGSWDDPLALHRMEYQYRIDTVDSDGNVTAGGGISWDDLDATDLTWDELAATDLTWDDLLFGEEPT